MHDLQTGEAIDAAGSTADAYIVILERGKDLIAQIIKAVAAGLEEGGVLVHCQGGRDRTGIVVALLLSVAGVPRDVIAEDYALSEVMLEPLYLQWVEDQIRATGRHPGKPRYMHAVLDYLDRAYGGVEGYLEASGVTPAEMEQIRKHLITTAGDASS
jgi:protein tyrosine/serine phosphatase